MSFFGQPPALDDHLAGRIIGEGARIRRAAEKALSKSQAAIAPLLMPGEEVRAIAQTQSYSSEVLLVTSQRLLRLKNGKVQWSPIALRDVGETNILAINRRGTVSYLVEVLTHLSRLYVKADHRRFDPDQYLTVEFDEPRDAQALCAVLDMLVEQAGA